MGIGEMGTSHHERFIGLIRPNTLLADDLNMPCILAVTPVDI